MNIIRAKALGMCFGVRDAITLAQTKAAAAPLTVLGDLVHNDTVLADLQARGVRIENLIEDINTREVLITAHGASRRTIQTVRDKGLNVTEATCPLVHYAHRTAAQFAAQGYYPVVIGQPNHVEVRGITGDLVEYSVILTEKDVAHLPERPRYGLLAQTTQPTERTRQLVALVQRRFPRAEVRYIDTICRPTKQRQEAAAQLARQADIVIVVGGARSNNTRELVATCGHYCARVHHVQTADDLSPEWFQDDDMVGLTAGTSTPDNLIDAVEARLMEWAAVGRPRAIYEPLLAHG
jgi:4-hydroxy-3-methylbut-2-enyl diphosphate reductase